MEKERAARAAFEHHRVPLTICVGRPYLQARVTRPSAANEEVLIAPLRTHDGAQSVKGETPLMHEHEHVPRLGRFERVATDPVDDVRPRVHAPPDGSLAISAP